MNSSVWGTSSSVLFSFLCAFLFLSIAVAGRIICGKWTNLLTIFSGFYGATIFFASFQGYGIWLANHATLSVMMLGIVAYAVGYFGVLAWHQGGTETVNFDQKAALPAFLIPSSSRSVRKKLAILFLILVMGYALYRFYILITLLRSGYSYQMVRTIYFSADYFFDDETASKFGRNPLDIYFMQPMLIAVYFLACINLFSNVMGFSSKNKLIYWVVSFLSVGITAISNGGRELIFYSVLVLGFCFLSIRSNKKLIRLPLLNKKQVKWIIRFGIIAVVALVLVSVFRNQTKKASMSDEDNFGFLRTVYLYFTGYLPHFSVRMEALNENEHTHGFAFLLGLIKFPMAIIRRIIPFDTPESYALAESVTTRLQQRVNIGGGSKFNAYTSLFYYFYLDFGYLSVLLESLIFGAVCSKCEVNYQKKKTVYHCFCYLFCFYLIITSMVRWEMVHPKTAMILYFIPVIFKMSRRNTDRIS